MKSAFEQFPLAAFVVVVLAKPASACGVCAWGMFEEFLPPVLWWCLLAIVWLVAVAGLASSAGKDKGGLPGPLAAFLILCVISVAGVAMIGPLGFFGLLFCLPLLGLSAISSGKLDEDLARHLKLVTAAGVIAAAGLFLYGQHFRGTRAHVEYMKVRSGPAAAQGKLTECKSNEKDIGTALEMYSIDYSGRYPVSLSKLTPNYLKTIPTCPSDKRDSYSDSYVGSCDPDLYTLYCRGDRNHEAAGAPEGFPQYTSIQGVLERP